MTKASIRSSRSAECPREHGQNFATGGLFGPRFAIAMASRKERPAIVVTPTEEIGKQSPLVVVAITTTFREPPPEDHVSLPWNNNPRRVGTGLAQRSAAVVTWLDTLYADEILDLKGDVPPQIMREIQRQLQLPNEDAL